MPDQIELDHLAVASRDLTEFFPRFAGDLGGGWVGMAPDEDFSFAQLRFGNGPRLEMLEPREDADDDFLWRFLDRSGPGPHNVTFNVPDLHAVVGKLTEAGYDPVRVREDGAESAEAILHPKEATGVVVRLLEVPPGPPITPVPEGVTVPPARVNHAAHLDWIGHVVASLDDALRLFAGILDGVETKRGDSDSFGLGARWVELEWPVGGRIRFFEPASDGSPLHEWLDGRSGHVHHLAISVEDPAGVPDAVEWADGVWEVPPENNLGIRLFLRQRQAINQEAAAAEQATGPVPEAPDAVLLP